MVDSAVHTSNNSPGHSTPSARSNGVRLRRICPAISMGTPAVVVVAADCWPKTRTSGQRLLSLSLRPPLCWLRVAVVDWAEFQTFSNNFLCCRRLLRLLIVIIRGYRKGCCIVLSSSSSTSLLPLSSSHPQRKCTGRTRCVGFCNKSHYSTPNQSLIRDCGYSIVTMRWLRLSVSLFAGSESLGHSRFYTKERKEVIPM